jgi:hypothetical protein
MRKQSSVLVFEESELPRNGDGIMKNIYKDTKPTE